MAYVKSQLEVLQQIAATGLPLVGGRISAYVWDTVTAQAMYTSSAGAGSATYFTLNSLGQPQSAGGTAVDIFLDDTKVYKFIITDSNGTQVGPVIGPVYPGGIAALESFASMEAVRTSETSRDYIETHAFYAGGTTGGAKLYRSGTGTPTGSGAAVIAAALAAGTFCNAAGVCYDLDVSHVNDVCQFGATGDGSTDDSACIISAIEWASAAHADLWFTDGTYVFNTPKGATLGSGTDRSLRILFTAGAWIKRTSDGPSGDDSVQSLDFAGADSFVEIYGMKWDGDGQNRGQDYVDLGTVSGIKVIGYAERVNVIRATGIKHLAVYDSQFLNCRGMPIAATSCGNFVATGNTINGASAAIQCNGTTNVLVQKNIIANIALVPDSFNVDGVAATLGDADNWHMQFGDAVTINGGNGVVSGNIFRNVSRCAILGETSEFEIIADGNLIVNDSVNLRCGNPSGMIWMEQGKHSTVKNNVILQKARNATETQYYSMVFAGSATGAAHDTVMCEGNTIIHYDYRASASGDKCLKLDNPNGLKAAYYIKNNIFMRLGVNQTGETINVYQGGNLTNGALDLSENFIYQEGNTVGTKAINFDVDTAGRTWWEWVKVCDNIIYSPNKAAMSATTDYSIRFDTLAGYTDLVLDVSDNTMIGTCDGIYMATFTGKQFTCIGNGLAGFDFSSVAPTVCATIDDNVIHGNYNNDLRVSSGSQWSTFAGNNIKGRLRLGYSGAVSKLVVKNNELCPDVAGTSALRTENVAYTDVIIESNSLIATANSQQLMTISYPGQLTRCSVSKNTFTSGGFSSVSSIYYSNAGTPVDSVIGGNVQLNCSEGGSGAPRNTGI